MYIGIFKPFKGRSMQNMGVLYYTTLVLCFDTDIIFPGNSYLTN